MGEHSDWAVIASVAKQSPKGAASGGFETASCGDSVPRSPGRFLLSGQKKPTKGLAQTRILRGPGIRTSLYIKKAAPDGALTLCWPWMAECRECRDAQERPRRACALSLAHGTSLYRGRGAESFRAPYRLMGKGFRCSGRHTGLNIKTSQRTMVVVSTLTPMFILLWPARHISTVRAQYRWNTYRCSECQPR